MKYRTLEEYKKEVFDELDDNKKLEWMYQMSKQLCNIVEYAKNRCNSYLEDLGNDDDCEYCDGAFASCRKVLQLAGEDIKKYE